MRNRKQTLETTQFHLPDISRNGTLELRSEPGRKPSFCVRFRIYCPETGANRQRRLNIGDDPELHDLVRTAIMTRVRNQIRAKAAKNEAAKQRKQAQAAEDAFMDTILTTSRRKRQMWRRAFRNSHLSGEPLAISLYKECARAPAPKRPGRPLKSRLW